MTDTRDTVRDGVRDTVRDTTNAVRRNTAPRSATSMIGLITAVVVVVLLALYALGMFRGPTSGTMPADGTSESTTTQPTPTH